MRWRFRQNQFAQRRGAVGTFQRPRLFDGSRRSGTVASLRDGNLTRWTGTDPRSLGRCSFLWRHRLPHRNGGTRSSSSPSPLTPVNQVVHYRVTPWLCVRWVDMDRSRWEETRVNLGGDQFQRGGQPA